MYWTGPYARIWNICNDILDTGKSMMRIRQTTRRIIPFVVPARAAQVEERPTATAAISDSRCTASTNARIHYHYGEAFSKTVIHNTDAKLSKQVRQPLKTNQGIHKALTWRVVDIAVGAAVGVMSGVMFWVFDGLSYGLFPLMTLILPGSAALLHALFYFPATLAL